MTEAASSIRIAPEVLATIVNLTTMSVPGIVAMANVPRGGLLSRRPQPDATRGVQAAVRDKGVHADVYVVVAQGVNMVTVGNEVQRSVTQAVHEMLGMVVRTVNVYIQGVE
jgi:uncharacterized alkaline shock family protein YloU